jgi:plasmid stabilization system protein ParE
VSRRVLFEPEASAELEEAAHRYEAQRSGLGLTFLAAVEGAVERLAAWPESGSAVPGVPASLSVRQLPVSRFPYRIVYMIASEELRVLAVAHSRRRPGYWRSRTQP